jgi:hypothetical protein
MEVNMGYGDYSYTAHTRITQARAATPRAEVFKQRSVHPLMNPFGVGIRESRDCPEHPSSLPIVFALDVTGSMGSIPDQLAREELPRFMQGLLDGGVTDPQVMFMAVGDAGCDQGPLQVGQFESTAEDMDRWLTWTWLESGGGGNNCESYDLAMYFAARHTDTDAVRKRGKRGYFFMTGDENPYPFTARNVVKRIIGDDLDADVPLEQVCEELARAYHPFFLIPDQGRRGPCEEAWRKAMGDHVILMDTPRDTCHVAAALVGLCEGLHTDLDAAARRLEKSGLKRERVAGIIRALTPFAATLGREGGPAPALDAVAYP